MTFPSVNPARDRARLDQGYLEPTPVQLAVLEADAESADLVPAAADQEIQQQESKALDKAAREWQDTQAALRKLNVRLRRARLPPIT